MEKLKQSRAGSFIAVALVYLIAGAVGVCAYCALPYSWWLNLLIADVLATIVTFVFSIIFSNASVYDPYWSVQPMVIVTAFSLGREINLLRLLLLVVINFWGARLTANWAYTFKNLYSQDWRYTMLKENTKSFYPIVNFFGIHMVPTLIVYACVLPAVYAFINNVSINAFGIAAICLSAMAVLLQGASDIQMHRFRKNKTGGFIREGFWKHSRHPNYLGEILMWWGIAISVWSADVNSFSLLLGAFANTLLFLFISIPMADKHQSRKDGFSEYKSETRMLLPIKK